MWTIRIYVSKQVSKEMKVIAKVINTKYPAWDFFYHYDRNFSKNSLKWSHFFTDHNKYIDLCIKPLLYWVLKVVFEYLTKKLKCRDVTCLILKLLAW